jgi:hypothetical protein
MRLSLRNSLALIIVIAISLIVAIGAASGEEFIPPAPDSKTLSANDGGPDGCDSSRFKCVMEGKAVLDKQTGLTWARNANILGMSVPYEEAAKLCEIIEIGGKNDWRLPTRDELIVILDTSKSSPALPEGHPFTNVLVNVGNCDYWTCSECEGDSKSAWMVRMTSGTVMDSYKIMNAGIWPVRNDN